MQIGFTGLLFLIFLVLKLTDVINWSYWYVTMPLWAPILIWLFVAIFAVTISAFQKPRRY